jgi:DNA-binding MarR family transcriptional regulator
MTLPLLDDEGTHDDNEPRNIVRGPPVSGASAAHALARLTRHLEHGLSEVNLTLPQYRVLLFLENSPDAANRLAAKLHVRPPSLTAVIDGLVARGYVARETDPDDRRRIKIGITTPGSEALSDADEVAAARLGSIEALDPASRPLVESLAQWQEALEVGAGQRRALIDKGRGLNAPVAAQTGSAT